MEMATLASAFPPRCTSLPEISYLMVSQSSYNIRLFTTGTLRPYFHHRRYLWLQKEIERQHLKPRKVIELGCFDAKSLLFLPEIPEHYLGLDANWEGGLDQGRERWKDDPRVDLRLCRDPGEIPSQNGEVFDVGIAMEVFEYLSDDMLSGYLLALAKLVRGPVFISIPVERGLPFLVRHVGKKFWRDPHFPVTASEFCDLLRGRVGRVRHDGHKGFDDRSFVSFLNRYFEVVSVKGLFPGFGPASWNLQVGIVARSRGATPGRGVIQLPEPKLIEEIAAHV